MRRGGLILPADDRSIGLGNIAQSIRTHENPCTARDHRDVFQASIEEDHFSRSTPCRMCEFGEHPTRSPSGASAVTGRQVPQISHGCVDRRFGQGMRNPSALHPNARQAWDQVGLATNPAQCSMHEVVALSPNTLSFQAIWPRASQ